jgi:hypothetical protein
VASSHRQDLVLTPVGNGAVGNGEMRQSAVAVTGALLEVLTLAAALQFCFSRKAEVALYPERPAASRASA